MPTYKDHLAEMADDIYENRASDPRRARYLRDRLYEATLREIISLAGKVDPEHAEAVVKILAVARTSLQVEQIEISPIPATRSSVGRA